MLSNFILFLSIIAILVSFWQERRSDERKASGKWPRTKILALVLVLLNIGIEIAKRVEEVRSAERSKKEIANSDALTQSIKDDVRQLAVDSRQAFAELKQIAQISSPDIAERLALSAARYRGLLARLEQLSSSATLSLTELQAGASQTRTAMETLKNQITDARVATTLSTARRSDRDGVDLAPNSLPPMPRNSPEESSASTESVESSRQERPSVANQSTLPPYVLPEHPGLESFTRKQFQLNLSYLESFKTTEAGEDEIYVIVGGISKQGETIRGRYPSETGHWELNDREGDPAVFDQKLLSLDFGADDSIELVIAVMEEDGGARWKDVSNRLVQYLMGKIATASAALSSDASASDVDDVVGAVRLRMGRRRGDMSVRYEPLVGVSSQWDTEASWARRPVEMTGAGSDYKLTFEVEDLPKANDLQRRR